MAATLDSITEDNSDMTLEEEFNVKKNEMQMEEEVSKLRSEIRKFLENKED
jgi:hypothetical protein